MIRAEVLLPNETYCKRCAGEGRVPNEDSYISSTATEPRFAGMVECPANCANGIVLRDRRAVPRDDYAELTTRLVNQISADRDEWRARTAQLIEENRALRRVVRDQATLLDHAEPKGTA